MQCKFCGRDGTVTMIQGRGKPLTQEASQSGKHAPLMLFDCRGYEPVDFVFSSGWKVESVSFLILLFSLLLASYSVLFYCSMSLICKLNSVNSSYTLFSLPGNVTMCFFCFHFLLVAVGCHVCSGLMLTANN